MSCAAWREARSCRVQRMLVAVALNLARGPMLREEAGPWRGVAAACGIGAC